MSREGMQEGKIPLSLRAKSLWGNLFWPQSLPLLPETAGVWTPEEQYNGKASGNSGVVTGSMFSLFLNASKDCKIESEASVEPEQSKI